MMPTFALDIIQFAFVPRLLNAECCTKNSNFYHSDKNYYFSHPRAEAPRTAALAFMRPDTRNLALPRKILRTDSL